MRKLIQILILLILSLGAQAQENDLIFNKLSLSDLDTTIKRKPIKVISASRSQKLVNELPITSYVITKETIKEQNYRTLVDVLKDIPGFRVSQPGDAKIGETFTYNGLLGNYYTKILINGVPITPSGAPGMPISSQLPITQAERIEIITDPSSAVYGADAIGGVINIVTEQNQKRANYGEAIFSVGNLGYNEANLLIGGKIGKDKNILKYILFANHSEISDLDTKDNYKNLYNLNNYAHIDTTGLSSNSLFEGNATSPYLGNLENSNSMYGLNMEYQGFKFSYFSMNRKNHSAVGKIPYYSSYQLPNTYWGEKINQLMLSYDYVNNSFHSQTNISYLGYRINNGSSELVVNPIILRRPSLNFVYGASDEINIDQLLNFQIDKKKVLSFGANFNYAGNLPISQSLSRPLDNNYYPIFSESVNSNNVGYYVLTSDSLRTLRKIYGSEFVDYSPITFSQFGLFTQLDMSFEKLHVLFDARYDFNSMYENFLSSRLALRYNFSEKFGVKFNVSQGFKSPNSYYRYSSFAFDSNKLAYVPFPNTSLENEKLRAIGIGFNFRPDRNNSFELLANYYMRENEIVFSFNNPDLNKYGFNQFSYYGFINNKGYGARNLNIIAKADFKNLIESVKFDLGVSLTYQKSNESSNPNLLIYDTYRIQPEFMGKIKTKVNLYESVDLILNTYFNSDFENNYFDFYKVMYPGIDVRNSMTEENNMAIWSDLILSFTKTNISFYTKVSNILNSRYAGIQTNDPLTGLFYNPQPGRMYSFGVKFSMQ